jgi:hypothetical protein
MRTIMALTGYVVENLADFTPAKADTREHVLMRYCTGRGRFSQDKKFINLQLQMFDPYGQPDGRQEGVWQALFTDPQQLFAVPPQPQRQYDVPVGPIPVLQPAANTKGIWTFGDGSSLTAVGPAMTTLTRLDDGSLLFMVSTMQWITNGTGRWAGAQGLKSSLGSTQVPAGVDPFSPGFVDFYATTIDTFRVMPGQWIATPVNP